MLNVWLSFFFLTSGVCGARVAGGYHDQQCQGGRHVIVQLFGWSWTDIAAECENVLGPAEYCAVQISPPNEHAMVEGAPWWERYEPVSYQLISRGGSEDELADMVSRCNNVGVRIYADAVINHMAEATRFGVGSAGSVYDSDEFYFPDVPYSRPDFNGCQGCPVFCSIGVGDWSVPQTVRNCRLQNLLDLNQKVPNVINQISGYMNRLIQIGVAGFRLDSARNMWPSDIKLIVERLHDLNENWFPSDTRPFIFQEVIDMNLPGEIRGQSYTESGVVTEFRFGPRIRNATAQLSEISNLYDSSLGMLSSEQALVFVDNHFTQRGIGISEPVLSFSSSRAYKMAQAITLAYGYGIPRVMSSYEFIGVDDGPPSSISRQTSAFNGKNSCAGGWVCEHRWPAIIGMVGFSKATLGEPVKGFRSDGNEAAWSRGPKGFFVISNENMINKTFASELPPGDYCDVVGGRATNTGCTGNSFTVDSNGSVTISLLFNVDDLDEPMIAIHIGALFGSGPPETTTEGTTTESDTTVNMTTAEATTEYITTTEATTEYMTTTEATTEYMTTTEVTTEYMTTTEATTEYMTTVEPTTEYMTTVEATTEYRTTAEATTEYMTTTEATTEYMTTVEATTKDITTEEVTTVAATTETVPTTSESPLKRTVVMIYKETEFDTFVFMRGGIEPSRRPGCRDMNPETSPCAIDITHVTLGTSPHYDPYEAWSVNNLRLNWAESGYPGQGRYRGEGARGTPMAWTSNNLQDPGYQPLNRWGEHYWMADFVMDCSQTIDGWFEVSAVHVGLSAGDRFEVEEPTITQVDTCAGTRVATKPFNSSYHIALCGHFNLFEFNQTMCVID